MIATTNHNATLILCEQCQDKKNIEDFSFDSEKNFCDACISNAEKCGVGDDIFKDLQIDQK